MAHTQSRFMPCFDANLDALIHLRGTATGKVTRMKNLLLQQEPQQAELTAVRVRFYQRKLVTAHNEFHNLHLRIVESIPAKQREYHDGKYQEFEALHEELSIFLEKRLENLNRAAALPTVPAVNHLVGVCQQPLEIQQAFLNHATPAAPAVNLLVGVGQQPLEIQQAFPRISGSVPRGEFECDDTILFANNRVSIPERCHSSTELSSSKPEATARPPSVKQPTQKAIAAPKSFQPEPRCDICSEGHLTNKCSTFIDMTVVQRISKVKKRKVCFNCLRAGHLSVNCTSKKLCSKCRKRHHTLLHEEPPKTVDSTRKSATQPATMPAVSTVTAPVGQSATRASVAPASQPTGLKKPATAPAVSTVTASVDLPAARAFVAPVSQPTGPNLQNPKGEPVPCRILMDNGSQLSTFDPFTGIGTTETFVRQSVLAEDQSRHSSFTASVECFIVPTVAGTIPSTQVGISSWPIPTGLQLVDPKFHPPDRIDMLDVSLSVDLLKSGQQQLTKSLPELRETHLGRVVAGEEGGMAPNPLFVHNATLDDIHEAIHQFWRVEELECFSAATTEYKECAAFFRSTYQRDCTGRSVVPLPFRQAINERLDNRRDHALRRFLSLLSFCKHPITFAATAEMYRQIDVTPSHTCFHRILWRSDRFEFLRVPELTTATYGTAAVPFVTTRWLAQLCKDDCEKLPLADRIVREHCYVDDILSRANTPEEATECFRQLRSLLACERFPVLSSNKPNLMKLIPECDHEKISLDESSIRDVVKAPRLVWSPGDVEFRFLAKPILMQLLWFDDISWDEPLNGEILFEWNFFQEAVPGVFEIQIPRHAISSTKLMDIYLIPWFDSQVVLEWCKKPPALIQVFDRNRVEDTTKCGRFKKHPANIMSRGHFAEFLASTQIIVKRRGAPRKIISDNAANLKNTLLTSKEYATALTEVEANLDSWHLCAIPSDPTDLEILASGHFLISRLPTAIPVPSYRDVPTNRLSRWQYLQLLREQFGRLFRRDHLSASHQPRVKNRKKSSNL